MANLLQSSQTQATTAPQFYTDYLSNLASQGQQAASQAQYAGAQPLQEQAFQNIGTAGQAFQPTLSQAGDVLSQAAGAISPLTAGQPYMTAATGSPAALAAQYMNPFVSSAAQGLSDIAMRNIQQNLDPTATAAAVGSGQFGSQRGAQVQGQLERQALQDLNTQLAQMYSTGYGQALQAGTAQNQLLGQLGTTAGQQAAIGQQNLTQAGGALSQLAGQNQALNLADINALATLGGQQQTIAQNAQNYPLTKLANLAALMQGQQLPTTVTTQMTGSPLSALAGLGYMYSTPMGQGLMSQLGSLAGSAISGLKGLMPGGSSGPDASMSGSNSAITTQDYGGPSIPSTSYAIQPDGSGGTLNNINSFGQNTTQADIMAP